MATEAVSEARIPIDGVGSGDLEVESLKVEVSSNGEVIGDLLRVSDMVTNAELQLACASEKGVNLSVLMMHVATRESELENFASESQTLSLDSAEKAMEYDLLSQILDSEVAELDKFTISLQTELEYTTEIVSSCKQLGDTVIEIEEKLHDSEKSLKQLQDQLSEIRMQSSEFQRMLPEEGNWNHNERSAEDGQFLNATAEIKMQTAEQQRRVLRMLEKSLARELDLEQRLVESRQYEEERKRRLFTYDREVFCMEEEASDVWEKFLEAQNAAEVFMGVSKELLGRLQILQFNLNGSIQREAVLRSMVESSNEDLRHSEATLQRLESSNTEVNRKLLAQRDSLKDSLKEAEDKLDLANSEASTLKERVITLEKQLKECECELSDAKALDSNQEQYNNLSSKISQMETEVVDLKGKLSEAETKVENAEAKSKLLAETNMGLEEELNLLKVGGVTSEKMESLERQLKEADIQRQHAVATAEASQEKQNMLYSTIGDMENLIEDLKSKVSRAESRADAAEENCIILSESNAELNEELRYMRDRLESLEVSVHQAEESKMETAKDIGIRTKLITNLVMQLAIERERLHRQITSLASQNNRLVAKLLEATSVPLRDDNKRDGKEPVAMHGSVSYASAGNNKEDVAEFSATSTKPEVTKEDVADHETDAALIKSPSDLENVRRIDAGLMSSKHIILAMLVLLSSAVAYYIGVQS